jgi:hypothetical protein
MAGDEASWPALKELIQSGQVPDQRVWEIMVEHPDFCKWYTQHRRSETMSNVVPMRRQRPTTAEMEASLKHGQALLDEVRQQADMAIGAFTFDLVKLIGIDLTAKALDDAANRLRALGKGAK